ncbi:hypothetical protein ASPCADRAFT_60827, partial [Aspergillus carbonarius ITEM 5010]
SCNYINKLDFLKIYFKTHQQSLIKSNIINRFKVTDLIPLDSKQVLSQFNIYLKILSTPDSQLNSSVL